MTSKPKVSVIIVNWNGGDVFKECIKSLSKITYPNWEFIVVDNGSADGSQKLPWNFQLPISNFQIIQNKENVGFAEANNQGFKKAKGEYILLLNNDTKVTPDFLDKLVDRMEKDEDLGVIQPKVYFIDGFGRLDNAGSFMTRIGFLDHWGFGEKDSKEFEKMREVFSAKGACMLIRRNVIEKIGLFDTDFHSYFEESDFCWRVWLFGYKVLFYPEAKIEHRVGYTISRLDVGNLNYHYYKNRIASLIKNLSKKYLITILPLHLFISLGISFAFLLRGKIKNSKMIFDAIFWNVRNLKNILEKRNKIQNMRKVSDKKLFKNLMHKIDWKKFYNDFKRVEQDISS